MADGGGKGHFTTLAEMMRVVAEHERRLGIVEYDVNAIADKLFGKAKRPRRRKPKKG